MKWVHVSLQKLLPNISGMWSHYSTGLKSANKFPVFLRMAPRVSVIRDHTFKWPLRTHYPPCSVPEWRRRHHFEWPLSLTSATHIRLFSNPGEILSECHHHTRLLVGFWVNCRSLYWANSPALLALLSKRKCWQIWWRWPKYLDSHVHTSSRSFQMVVDKKLGISPLRRTEPIRDGTGQYGQKCHHFQK